MVEDGVDRERPERTVPAHPERAAGREPARRASANTVEQPHAGAERPDADQLVEGCAPGGFARHVDEVQYEASGLSIEMAVEKARALDRERQLVPGGPAHGVGEEPSVAAPLGGPNV
jgi:hypothetical protein